jgi:ribosomal protein L25 (general stress protein Ctc)
LRKSITNTYNESDSNVATNDAITHTYRDADNNGYCNSYCYGHDNSNSNAKFDGQTFAYAAG